MRITGKGVWGPPDDHDEAIRVLRRAVELGVNFIDTADSYGPVRLRGVDPRGAAPLSDGVVVATKAGLLRTGPDDWIRSAFRLSAPGVRDEPAPPRRGAHRPVPAAPHRPRSSRSRIRSVSSRELQQEGKIRHIGLSEVDVEQLEAAQKVAPIVSVQNMYNLTARTAEPVLEACEAKGSASSRGSRWRPAAGRGRRPAASASPPTTTRPRRSSPSPGCSSARR